MSFIVSSSAGQPFWRKRRIQSPSPNTSGPPVKEAGIHETHVITRAVASFSDMSSLHLSGNSNSNGDEESTRAVQEIREHSELDSLNASLQIMCHVFPDVRPEVFRELLATLSPESRLQLAVENVLRGKQKLVRGRWRVEVEDQKSRKRATGIHQRRRSTAAKEKLVDVPTQATSETDSPLPADEKFRTEEYKEAVKTVLYQEFKALSRSTIKAVLAEHNYSYTNSRPTLIALMSKSWRWSLANLFSKRNKPPLPTDHPLLIWHSSKHSEVLEPSLRYTFSEELNRELEQTLIRPFHALKLADQLKHDGKLAQRTNEAEAEECGAMFECQCCFTPSPFEYITTCAAGGHFMCSRCVTLTLGEAVFGQGWMSSVDTSKSSLKCFALNDNGGSQQCDSCIPRQQVKRALCTDRNGEDTWKKFEDRLTSDILTSSGIPLARCGFCSYAEIHEPPDEPCPALSLSDQKSWLKLTVSVGFIACIASLQLVSFVFLSSLLLLVAFGIMTLQRKSRYPALPNFSRLARLSIRKQPEYAPHHGQKFTCRNPACSRISCLRCSAPWQDIHICHRSARVALRTYIESAVTEAVKRTCPKCNISFIKASGCNKLVCVCGYSMCYLCRKEIGPREGYAHFCPHFRPNPGENCDKCDRCDLYRTENEDAIIERARARAIQDWKERQGSTSSKTGQKSVSGQDLDVNVDMFDDNDKEEDGVHEDADVGISFNNAKSSSNNGRPSIKSSAAPLIKRNNSRLRSVIGTG